LAGGLQRMSVPVLVLRQGEKETRVELARDVLTIGRDPSNDISLDDDMLTRRHLRVERRGGAYYVVDCESTNGTFVNGVAISEKRLKVGDQLQFGGHTAVYGDSSLTAAQMGVKNSAGVTVVLDKETTSVRTFVLPSEEAKEQIVDTALLEGASPGETKALRDLMNIYKVGNEIHSARSLQELADTVVEHAFKGIRADRGFLILLDEKTGDLVPVVGRGSGTMTASGEIRLTLSSSIAKDVLKGGDCILTRNALEDNRYGPSESILTYNIHSAVCAPLRGNTQIVGLIYFDTVHESHTFDKENLRFITAIANQAGIAIENMLLFNQRRQLLLGSLKALVASLEARDPYTHGHSERVAACSKAIGSELDLQDDTMEILELAALLHDIGKIGMPENILNKPGKLTEEEDQLKEDHPIKGAEILANISNIDEIIAGVRHHHERVDGAGYPDGLMGEDIPLVSRIIAVADAFDAMTSDRSYRRPFTVEETLDEMAMNGGAQFDANIVAGFRRAFDEGRIHRLLGPDLAVAH